MVVQNRPACVLLQCHILICNTPGVENRTFLCYYIFCIVIFIEYCNDILFIRDIDLKKCNPEEIKFERNIVLLLIRNTCL